MQQVLNKYFLIPGVPLKFLSAALLPVLPDSLTWPGAEGEEQLKASFYPIPSSLSGLISPKLSLVPLPSAPLWPQPGPLSESSVVQLSVSRKAPLTALGAPSQLLLAGRGRFVGRRRGGHCAGQRWGPRGGGLGNSAPHFLLPSGSPSPVKRELSEVFALPPDRLFRLLRDRPPPASFHSLGARGAQRAEASPGPVVSPPRAELGQAQAETEL